MRTLPSLAWDRPGHNPFRGSRWHAVMSFDQIPLTERVVLALRIQHDTPDGVALIDRHGLPAGFGPIRDMWFGHGIRASRVDTSAWPAGHTEPALMWWSGQWVVGLPLVCRNPFWTTRITPGLVPAPPAEVHQVPEPGTLALLPVALLGAVIARRRRLAK